MTALILDCDGVIADTEREGHLPAFNRTFEEFGLPVRWSDEDYRMALRIGGGKERMASLLTPEFVAIAGLPRDRDGQLARVAEWHQRKTELYVEMVLAGRLPARPGIRRIMEAAYAAGWQLAICSTSAEASVRAILDSSVGPDVARACLVLAGDVVPRKKPAADIYQLALRRLGIGAADTVAIEDSRHGLLAAVAAGLSTVITLNDYTAQQTFEEASLVVTSLGDPGGPRAVVVENRSAAAPGDYITLDDLAAVLG